VAIRPVPILAAKLILFTPQARSNGPGLVAGVGVGLLLVAVSLWRFRTPATWT
jgi:hypothetical protein